MDNEVSLTIEDLGVLTDMLEKANDSGGYVAGVFRFITNGQVDTAVNLAFDDVRGEHVVLAGVFAVFDE